MTAADRFMKKISDFYDDLGFPVAWEDAGKEIIPFDHQINKAIHLFDKIEDEKIQEQLDKLRQ